jgi:hypothetical protein
MTGASARAWHSKELNTSNVGSCLKNPKSYQALVAHACGRLKLGGWRFQASLVKKS